MQKLILQPEKFNFSHGDLTVEIKDDDLADVLSTIDSHWLIEALESRGYKVTEVKL